MALRGDQNILYFGSPKRENCREGEKRRGEEEEEEEEEKKKRSQDKKGMDSMILVWNCMDHLDFLYRYMFVGCGL